MENNDSYYCQELISNPLLIYEGGKEEKVNKKSGEVYYNHPLKHKNFIFFFQGTKIDGKFMPKKVIIKGSLHKYWNDGIHNANDFSFLDFLSVIEQLDNDFNILSYQWYIRTLEFGANLNDLKDVSLEKLLTRFFFYNKTPFIRDKENEHSISAGVRGNNDIIQKFYLKHLEYPQYTETPVLRYETKYCKNRPLKKFGIEFLSDLLEKRNHEKLMDQMVLDLENILFADYTVNKQNLNKRKINLLTDYENLNYWKDTIARSKQTTSTRNNFNNRKKAYKNIITENSENLILQISNSLIIKKCVILNQETKLCNHPLF